MIILGWLVCLVISILFSVSTVAFYFLINFSIRAGISTKVDYYLILIPLTVVSLMWYVTVVNSPFVVG